MTKLELLNRLNHMLLEEMPRYKAQAEVLPETENDRWFLFRSLVNLRHPRPVGEEFLKLQDELLQKHIADRGVVSLSELSPARDNLYLWQGDITALRTDAIVNAANSALTGCYIPLHTCIDNAIHTYSGVQLRLECAKLMQRQGFAEPAGKAKITKAYNLPCKHVLHTVGPIVSGRLTQEDCELLSSCYRSCLDLALAEGLGSIAFCCISTGEFHFPNREAAKIAVKTVSDFIKETDSPVKVVFNVFKDVDYRIYQELLR